MAERNEEIEARLRAEPGDGESYLVYADWLSDRGDPRGELIVLQDRIRRVEEIRRRARTILKTHETELLGQLLTLGDRNWEVEWDRGFVSSLVARPRDGDPDGFARVLPAVLRHPSFPFLRSFSLSVDLGAETPLQPAVDAVSTALPPTLTTLSLGLTGALPSMRGPLLGAPLRLTERTPRLSRLHLHGYAELSPSVLEDLREVSLFGGAAQAGDLMELGRHQWPRVERLSLFLGDDRWDHGRAARELLPALDRAFPNLSHLCLAGAVAARPTAEALLDSALVRRLESLGLTHGSADPTSVLALASDPSALGNLERLDLSGNPLSEAHLRDLSVLGCEIIAEPAQTAADSASLACSFCGRIREEVRRLIAGPCVYICDECVTLMGDILEAED